MDELEFFYQQGNSDRIEVSALCIYLVVRGGAPVGDLCLRDAAGFQAVSAEGAESDGRCAVEASYCPPVDRHAVWICCV